MEKPAILSYERKLLSKEHPPPGSMGLQVVKNFFIHFMLILFILIEDEKRTDIDILRALYES